MECIRHSWEVICAMGINFQKFLVNSVTKILVIPIARSMRTVMKLRLKDFFLFTLHIFLIIVFRYIFILFLFPPPSINYSFYKTKI